MTVQTWLSGKRKSLKDDLIAGLIVAIVALPLAIGFAIASDVPPAMGIVTAIIGGLIAAIIGGSEYQISGPTGAMVVVVLSVVHDHGINGLVLATLLAGIILLIIAALKLGKIIEYIPSPVIVGFTAGIAVIIFFGQLNNLLGISPSYPDGAPFVQKTIISVLHAAEANVAAIMIALLTIIILVATPRISKKVPGGIIAVVVTTLLAVLIPFFAVRTVGDIGTIPQSLPIPHVPELTLPLILILLPAALTIATLAAIESLLSAVVADGLTDTKHKPNQELVGQGLANIGSALFGGMPVTGAIARTATNIRNGGKTRLAGILHALFLLIFVLAAASLAMLIPLAALAGILMFVAFNMVEWERIFLILKTPLSDVAVMVTTFLLTILVDLTVAIEVGLMLAALLFMKRMSDLYHVSELESATGNRAGKVFQHRDISVYTISGPLFFGAASRFDQQVGTTPGGHKPIKIIRMRFVPVIDATGLNFIEATWHKHRKLGGAVLFATVHRDVEKVMRNTGLYDRIGKQCFFPTTRAALAHALRLSRERRKEPVATVDLDRFDLTAFDIEERSTPAPTSDVDPVEEMLDSVGVTTAHKMSRKGLRQARKVGEQGVRAVQMVGEGGIKTVAHVGEEGVKAVQELSKHGVRTVRRIGKNARRIKRTMK